MTNRRWRLLIGASIAGLSFLLAQAAIQDGPVWLLIILGTANAVLGFLNVPDDGA